MSFEKTLMETKPRKTPIAWEDLIGNILDQYRQHIDDLAHAVQKDAIQNSWDARISTRPLRIKFQLYRDTKGIEMFIMEDHGTTGLTGRVLPEEDYNKDLPEEERWGRFQGLAFRRENPKALGARGQGKFVFVGVSENGIIIYDTLRTDSVYRLGVRKLGDLWEKEGKDAIRLLKAYSQDLDPLTEIGTRVIIVNPVSELKRAVEDGRFVRYIQTTWWPILLDPKVEIIVATNKKNWKVGYPKDLNFPSSDSKNIKIWKKEWVVVKRSKSKQLRGISLKKLHLCWNRDPISEDIRGIAVLRGGMVVERIPITELIAGFDVTLADHIYGYVEGDLGAEFLLKKIEGPTHYRFKRRGGWGRKNIFGVIKEYISGQLQLFARDKLGQKESKKEPEDFDTIRAFNRLIKSLNISVLAATFSTERHPRLLPKPTKDLDLVFPLPDFAHPLRKVDFNQEISNIRFDIVNRSDFETIAHIKVYTEQDFLVRESIVDKSYRIPPNLKLSYGPFRLKIEKGKYTRGKCQIRGKLICLSHPNYEKGKELDKAAHTFWIGEEPPPRAKGPFREIERRPRLVEKIGDRFVDVASKVEPHPDAGYNLLVNVSYPLYSMRSETKEDEADYIIELMARRLPHVLIANEHELFHEIDDPNEILRRSWAIYSEILSKYYSH
ncbi:hypothetical protein KAU55_00200 [Candidatus Bathyarchaeota archaeon]|nr:hypothetical protein [Candidatus Bathyarchaeota archaeon]